MKDAGLVYKWAEHYRPWLEDLQNKSMGAMEYEDLVQEGFEALLVAEKKYEDRGYKFSTYASFCIRNKMSTALRKCGIVRRPHNGVRL